MRGSDRLHESSSSSRHRGVKPVGRRGKVRASAEPGNGTIEAADPANAPLSPPPPRLRTIGNGGLTARSVTSSRAAGGARGARWPRRSTTSLHVHGARRLAATEAIERKNLRRIHRPGAWRTGPVSPGDAESLGHHDRVSSGLRLGYLPGNLVSQRARRAADNAEGSGEGAGPGVPNVRSGRQHQAARRSGRLGAVTGASASGYASRSVSGTGGRLPVRSSSNCRALTTAFPRV